ncbi:beta-lactamase superfamily domain-containing protein [Penicillium riverlandense]|uniref:beta-lactamase superfamily domain-containing protein n=1 Tax=Penicillium riverlandense TaxID=1903569 RepID=UPI0025490995|nr:beta-lactamase superfamily domain-containing protein [Penicillium riverlandense]KAJ5814806.1 beta-lactamase superfamily domain-containing protein [Penicillium riverlandense]
MTALDESSPLRATFLGVSTILFDDGVDSILIDGFFTRPWYFSTLLGSISPNEQKVSECLQRAGIDQRLHAVLVAHSHYDHVLDAPTVCKMTGAKLVGSSSTQQVGKGHGLSDEQIVVCEDQQKIGFGNFQVTIIEGIHSPGDVAPGDITEPLQTPCSMTKFRTGKCFSFFIQHGSTRIFVHPSANFVPGKLCGFQSPTLFLGIGAVGKQSSDFREQYWEHVVQAIQPNRIIPIHWDNFFYSLDRPLFPLPWFADTFSVTETWLKEGCAAAGITLRFPKSWEVMDHSYSSESLIATK